MQATEMAAKGSKNAEGGSGDVGDVPVEERKRVAAKGGAKQEANADQPKPRPRRHYPLHLLVACPNAAVGPSEAEEYGEGEEEYGEGEGIRGTPCHVGIGTK